MTLPPYAAGEVMHPNDAERFEYSVRVYAWFWEPGQVIKPRQGTVQPHFYCDCSCCEFRQFVAGGPTFTAAGRTERLEYTVDSLIDAESSPYSLAKPPEREEGMLPWYSKANYVFTVYDYWGRRFIEDVVWPFDDDAGRKWDLSPANLWHPDLRRVTEQTLLDHTLRGQAAGNRRAGHAYKLFRDMSAMGKTEEGRKALNKSVARPGEPRSDWTHGSLQTPDVIYKYCAYVNKDDPYVSLEPLNQPVEIVTPTGPVQVVFDECTIDSSFLFVGRTADREVCQKWFDKGRGGNYAVFRLDVDAVIRAEGVVGARRLRVVRSRYRLRWHGFASGTSADERSRIGFAWWRKHEAQWIDATG